MKRHLPSKSNPPDGVDALVGVVAVVIGWFAAVGIQSYADTLRWERAEQLMRLGLEPEGKGPYFVPLFVLSAIAGLLVPLLLFVGFRWLRQLRPGAEARIVARPREARAPAAAPRTDVDVSPRDSPSAVCPYCKDTCGEEGVVRCASCDARQHSECLELHGRCAVCGRQGGFEPVRA